MSHRIMDNIKEEHKIILLVFIVGVGLFVGDAFVDAYIFFDESFLNSLVFHVSGHEFYLRVFILLAFIIFSVLISKFIKKQRIIAADLNKAIAAAGEEKSRFESIIAAIGDGISIQDRDFRVLYQNEVHKSMIGDHIGKYCYKAYEKSDSICINCPIAKVFETGKVCKTDRNVETNNGIIHIEIMASPLKDADGNIIAGIEAVRDTTENKKMENLILQTKQDWEDTFNTISDMITIHDKDFNIIRANRAAEETLGFLKHGGNNDRKCYAYFHGKDTPPIECPSCDCLKTGKPASFEIYEPHLNRHLEINVIPRFDKDNEIIGLIHVSRDITNRKKAEEELEKHKERLSDLVQERTAALTESNRLLSLEINERRQVEKALRLSEHKYRNLYDKAPDMYYSMNRDIIITDCNETEAKMLGYKKEEIIGRPLADFFTENSRKLLKNVYPELKNKKVLNNLERYFVRKDGTIFPAIINVFAEFDDNGEIFRIRAIARDITELKKAERELRNVNRTLKVLSDFNHALLHLNEESELLDEICRIIVDVGGYSMAWVGYLDEGGRDTVHPVAQSGFDFECTQTISLNAEDSICPASEAILSDKISIARNTRHDPFLACCNTGGTLAALNSSVAIPLHEGDRIIGALNIYAREQDAFDSEGFDLLEKLAANLSYGIAVIRSNIERKRVEAEALRASHLASLGELAAGVAHEINNPINGIINYAQILSNKYITGIKEQDITQRIIREGDRIANIVRSLLSFARDRKEDKRQASIREIMSDSMALTETQIKKDGIRLLINIPDDLPGITVQARQIEQVFLNLISNARYALNQKYPHRHKDKVFEIKGEKIIIEGQPHVRITFHDRGTGIPSGIRDKILNPFFSTKPANMGTGLGLSISHGIIINHGGRINIESVEGEFTNVTVELPEMEIA